MKFLAPVFALLCLATSPVIAADDVTYEAVVTGMRCQACRAEVTRLLKEVPGIGKVEISGGEKSGEQKVVIHSANALTQAKAQEALGGDVAGFEITAWKKKS